MANQDYITVTNSPDSQYLAQNYLIAGPAPNNDIVRADVIDFSIQPVIENPPGTSPIFTADYDNTDTLSMGIGNFDTPPTGGNISLTANGSGSGLGTVAYNITAGALQSALNAAIVAGGGPLVTATCTVTLVTAGTYQITGATNIAVTTGFFATASAANLIPVSTGFFLEETLGSASTPYVILFVMQQQAMCYAEATVELDPADAVVTTVQAGSGTANKIQNISFTTGAFSGSATVAAVANSTTSTCGTITPTMTATQIGLVLSTHPQIKFNEADGTANNIAVTQLLPGSWNVEFIGTLGDNNSNALSIPNTNATGPQGKSGQIFYNTFNLWLYSLTQAGSSFKLTRQIQRTRASGEIQTMYSAEVTIQKSLINLGTAVPTPPTSYATTAALASGLAGKQNLNATLTTLGGKSTTGTGDIVLATGPTLTSAIIQQAGMVYTVDGAIPLTSGIAYIEKGSAAAMTIAAPSGQDNTRITIIGNTDFAHVITFTGTKLLDGTTGANITATLAAFAGSSITVVARGTFWLVESNNLVTCA